MKSLRAADRVLSQVQTVILRNLLLLEGLALIVFILWLTSLFAPGLLPGWLTSGVTFVVFIAVPLALVLVVSLLIVRCVVGFLDKPASAINSLGEDDAGRD